MDDMKKVGTLEVYSISSGLVYCEDTLNGSKFYLTKEEVDGISEIMKEDRAG